MDKITLTREQVLGIIQTIEACSKHEPNHELRAMITVMFLRDELEGKYNEDAILNP